MGPIMPVRIWARKPQRHFAHVVGLLAVPRQYSSDRSSPRTSRLAIGSATTEQQLQLRSRAEETQKRKGTKCSHFLGWSTLLTRAILRPRPRYGFGKQGFALRAASSKRKPKAETETQPVDGTHACMARHLNECNTILRNLSQEIRSRCVAEDQYCCYLHCCFVNRPQKEVWETWYFWFGVVLIAMLLVTSVTSFLVGACGRKRLELIRVHHRTSQARAPVEDAVEVGPTLQSPAPPVTAVTGADGLIQPHVTGGLPYGLPAEVAARYKAQGRQGTATAIFRTHRPDHDDNPDSLDDEAGAVAEADPVAGPLEPAYPPMQPVTIVRGTPPEGGFRRTDAYTELVLPPVTWTPNSATSSGPKVSPAPSAERIVGPRVEEREIKDKLCSLHHRPE